jgi:hypothetical protein
MRWWVLVALCGCSDFRAIEDIDRVSCGGTTALEAYGAVDFRDQTFDFEDPRFVSPGPMPNGDLEIADEGALLVIHADGSGLLDAYDRGKLAATSARVITDCGAPLAGRFEARFSSGDVSGWWRGYGGW